MRFVPTLACLSWFADALQLNLFNKNVKDVNPEPTGPEAQPHQFTASCAKPHEPDPVRIPWGRETLE